MADKAAKPEDDLSEDEIDVTPTRTLFVEMLTRDILLNRAIIDLVDNSVDGAKRLRPERDSDLKGLEIQIHLDRNKFSISDNCGGIGIDIARHYAFRFGRAKGMAATPGSVGQFGVGMKRALFKFGHGFEVVSTTATDHFELRVNVDEWEQEEGPWRFAFDKAEDGLKNSIGKTGTSITSSPLRSDASAQFGSSIFQNSLAREIQSAQQQYIDRNLRIVVNGKTLIATAWKLAEGAGIEPLYIEDFVDLPEGGRVNRRIYAGVADSSPEAAGWYVFCNGRMILEADQSRTTGWERGADEQGVSIPKFHGQFARFRGYVFLDSEDPSLLPWNTTKTGVDADTDVWRNTYSLLRTSMRPVIDFLNKLDTENDQPEGTPKPFQAALRTAPLRAVRSVVRKGPFSIPQPPPAPRGPPWTSIQFSKPKPKVDALRKALDARSNSHLGEILFDDAYEENVGD
ncbi:MAG TPA: ATP-binding protein [Allosphingosinicella sp.]